MISLTKSSKPSKLDWDIKYKRSHPMISHGFIFHLTFGMLNEIIQKTYRYGTVNLLHIHPILNIDYDDFNEFTSLLKQYSKKKTELKTFLNLNDISFLENVGSKCYFRDFTFKYFFRKEIQERRISGSTISENITYLYSNDLMDTSILSIFYDISNNNNSNLCIKMITLTSKVSFDILKIIHFICDETFIFKLQKENYILDSWYIIGKSVNESALHYVLKNLHRPPKENQPLMSILKNTGEETDLECIYKKFSLSIYNKIFNTLSKTAFDREKKS